MQEAKMAEKDELGRFGETLAVESLESQGMRVIERNWRCSQGEIDIIAQDGLDLVFVEVKTRSGLRFGTPLSAITAKKLTRLRRLVAAWCRTHPGPHHHVRIDAVSVLVPRQGLIEIDHVQGIF
jgi:putative endonuclease